MQITMVPYEEVERVWPSIEPYMDGAAEYTHGRFTADDILEQVLHYDHILWLAYENEIIKGAVVTSILNYPRAKTLSMVFTGGINLDEWKEPMLDVLRRWAKDNECDSIESTGRPGWAKVFKADGHVPLWHTYELPIENIGEGEQHG